MSIPPPPPPLPSIQSHMYAGSNQQDNRSHLDSMNPRHYTQQQQKYQPKIPIMYSSSNYQQQQQQAQSQQQSQASHASGKYTLNEVYNKPYNIKAAMSPHMRSPQHPSQQQPQTQQPPQKYHMDNSNNSVNSKIDLKTKYQPKMQQFSVTSNNNYQFNDISTSSMNDIRMLHSLELRRQEILGKIHYLFYVFS